jgi:Spy/CpxP family protein refolding chaperone
MAQARSGSLSAAGAGRVPMGGLMSTKRLVSSVAAAALAAWGWAAVAQAQGPGGPGPRDREFGRGRGPGPHLAEALGLSDDQKAQVDALHARQRETMKPLMDAAHQAREAFHSALETDGADPATVGQAALAMHAAEKNLRAAHEAAFQEMKSILTPEQQAKLEQVKEQRGPGRGPGRPRP